MKKTKIDWADSTWNPVTGCNHDCDYCYARKQAGRFGGFDHDDAKNPVGTRLAIGVQELDKPYYIMRNNGLQKAPYPWFFTPTFHRYRLEEPQHWKKPCTIFVGSMCDLFGAWVPDEWIREVFKACEAAPQHRYLFLTKNPARYLTLAKAGKLPKQDNLWFGTTITAPDEPFFFSAYYHCFVSIEPIFSLFDMGGFNNWIEWIIVGAETGHRKGKVIPEKRWLEGIERYCFASCTPLFMKESLRPIMGDEFRQEFPWEV